MSITRVLKFVLLHTADVMTRLLNVDRKTPVRSGRQRKTGAERTSQWTSSSTWESPASYPVTSRVFAAKREMPLTRETRTLRCGPHSRVSADNIEGRTFVYRSVCLCDGVKTLEIQREVVFQYVCAGIRALYGCKHLLVCLVCVILGCTHVCVEVVRR